MMNTATAVAVRTKTATKYQIQPWFFRRGGVTGGVGDSGMAGGSRGQAGGRLAGRPSRSRLRGQDPTLDGVMSGGGLVEKGLRRFALGHDHHTLLADVEAAGVILTGIVADDVL